MKGAKLLRHS